MASQDHGIHSFEKCVLEGSDVEVINFSRLWEECTQEESRLIIREKDGSN